MNEGEVLGHKRRVLKIDNRRDSIDQMISGFELDMDKREGRNMTRQKKTN